MILMSSSIVVYQISTVFYTPLYKILQIDIQDHFTIPTLHPLFFEWLINIHVYCRTEIILFYEHKWFAANKVQL